MIVISIHPFSVLIGSAAGVIAIGAIWIWTIYHDKGDFERGWDCGYEYGKGIGRSEMLRELERDKEGAQP